MSQISVCSATGVGFEADDDIWILAAAFVAVATIDVVVLTGTDEVLATNVVVWSSQYDSSDIFDDSGFFSIFPTLGEDAFFGTSCSSSQSSSSETCSSQSSSSDSCSSSHSSSSETSSSQSSVGSDFLE